MSFTPGNWQVESEQNIRRPYLIVGGNGAHIADVIWHQHIMDEDDEPLSNALLISAAPDLYEACVAALKVIDAYERDTDEIKMLRAAIAKAEKR